MEKRPAFIINIKDYPTSIRSVIYTTNWNEFRKRLKTMNSLPNEKAVEKIVYMIHDNTGL